MDRPYKMDEVLEHYKLVFSGRLVDGKTVNQIRPVVGKALKLSDEALERLFHPNAKSIVLKKVDSLDEAENLRQRFLKLGMIIEIPGHPEQQYLTAQSERTQPTQTKVSQVVTAPIENPSATFSFQVELVQQVVLPTSTVKSDNIKSYQPPLPHDKVESPIEIQHENEEIFAAPSALENFFDALRRWVNMPMLFVLCGLILSVIYFPYSDGLLRNGLIVGVIVFLAGLKFQRARN